MRKFFKNLTILAVWLFIWQAVSMITGLELLLAGPVAVFKEFIALMWQKQFYITVISSFLRITGGFVFFAVMAVILGIAGGKIKLVRDFIAPVIQMMKSLPVAAFIIIALMWFGSGNISFIIGGMVAVPIIYTSVVSGIANMDSKLNEMAAVFQMKLSKRIRYIYFPQVYPYVEGNIKVALGMCWKAGVSAEVIGLTANSIGSQMYYAKLYMLSADIFVWSIVVIVMSAVFERIFGCIMEAVKNALAA
ncbi:MAG: ABC transporter permease subunit [Eubacteriales bacterium]|nr:ABC transporter permease subunit [Eubacteriales bacterium]